MFDVHGFEMTIFKLLIGIILIVLHLRLTGKQQTTQMTPIDFIGNFILGGIIGGVIYNHAISFAEYVSFLLVTFAIISGLNYAMSKFMPTRSLVMGKAYRIIENGRFTEDVLTSEDNKIDPVELLAELRGMGIFSLSEVHFLQREANGSLTVRGVLIRSGTGYSCVMFDVHGFEMTIFKLLIGIILIVLHLRLTGKQQTTQMTPIDFIGNFILGGIIGGVIYNHAISFAEYVSFLLVTFAIISGLNYAMSKFMPTRSLVMGKAYRIIENGRFTEDVLTSEDNKIDPVELLAELRGMGIFSLSEVHFLQREANGSLTVRKKGEGRVNYVLVSNGQAVADNLELAHRDEDWLRGELKQAGIGELDDLFLVELDAAGQLNIVDQEGQTTSVRISDSNAQEVTTVTEFQAPQERSATLEDVIPEDARADAAESDG